MWPRRAPALVAEWATGKVQRVALARLGGDWKAEVSPFVTGAKSPVALLVAQETSPFWRANRRGLPGVSHARTRAASSVVSG